MTKNFDNKIEYFRELLDSNLKKIYNKGPDSLTQPINYVLSGKGKRFRPILTMIVADINDIPVKDVLYPSISIEMLHNFTLIHDDIMDKDTVRHGKETVHKRWDENTAILSGDAMLAISLRMLLKNNLEDKDNLIKTYIDGLLSVCEGQALDIEFEKEKNVNVIQYKNMIYLKTAYMIGLSAQIGGILSNLEKDKIKLLKDFGNSIGMAYQIQDDLLELFSNSESMNKSLFSDFTLKKKTFLWVAAKDELKDELNTLLSNFRDNKQKSIMKLREFVIIHKIREEAEDFIVDEINHANKLTKELDKTGFLRYYSNLIFKRDN